MLTVSIFGSYDPRAGQPAYETARAAGEVLARLGYAVANGGYGGTMEASAQGAKQAGGRTVGVVCSVWKSLPNAYVDQVVRTFSLLERLEKLIELGTGGYLVLPGATGTLVELAAAWELMCKSLMARRPLVCLGEFWRPVIELMSSARTPCAEYVTVAAGVEDLPRWFPPCKRA